MGIRRETEWCVHRFACSVCSVADSHLTLCSAMDYSLPGSTAPRIFQEEYWSGVPFPTPRDLPNPGIKLPSPVSPTLAGRFFTTSTTREDLLCRNVILIVIFIVIYMTVSLSHQEASTSLLSLYIRGQTKWKPQSQKTNQTGHMDHTLV